MDTDILIIGGGLSGLALADRLQREGRDWLLVEANDRLGGRIYSPEFEGRNFDLGPAWFWQGQPRMAKLAERFGIEVFEQFCTGQMLVQDYHGNVRAHGGFSPMQGSLRLAGGMQALITGLSGELPQDRIRCGCKLDRLEFHEDAIIGTTRTGKIRARHVVLALPPRLAASSIGFEPELPAAAIKAMQSTPTWMAGQAKFLAIFDQPYWRENGFSGDAMSHCGPLVEIHDASPSESGPYALFGFVGVPASARLENREKLIALARSQLIDIFGDALRSPLEVHLQDWAQVETIATSLDQQGSGGHPQYGYPIALKGIWGGRLILGSTETAVEFGGYLEGALEAAENAGIKLQNLPSLTSQPAAPRSSRLHQLFS